MVVSGRQQLIIRSTSHMNDETMLIFEFEFEPKLDRSATAVVPTCLLCSLVRGHADGRHFRSLVHMQYFVRSSTAAKYLVRSTKYFV